MSAVSIRKGAVNDFAHVVAQIGFGGHAGQGLAGGAALASWHFAIDGRAKGPVILGRREGCLACHGAVRGLDDAQQPVAERDGAHQS